MPDWTVYALDTHRFETCPGADVNRYARREGFTLFMRVEGSDALRRDIDRIVDEHR